MIKITVENPIWSWIPIQYKNKLADCMSYEQEYYVVPGKCKRNEWCYWQRQEKTNAICVKPSLCSSKMELKGRRKQRVVYQKSVIENRNGKGYFLTGFVPKIEKFLNGLDFPFEKEIPYWMENPDFPRYLPHIENLKFREDQIDLMNNARDNIRGVIISPTGSGKTLLQIGLLSTFGAKFKTLILMHTISLVKQTERELLIRGFKEAQAIHGTTTKEFKKNIIISTIQSFSKIPAELYKDKFDMVIVDECHHVSSAEGISSSRRRPREYAGYSKVLSNLNSCFRFGFTATIPIDAKPKFALEGLIGPVIGDFTIEEAAKKGILAKPKIKIIELTKIQGKSCYESQYQQVYQDLVVLNDEMNRKIISMCVDFSYQNKTSLIIVNKIEHGEILHDLGERSKLKIKFVQGKTDGDTREQIKQEIIKKKILAVICTTVWKEGINIPSLNVVINAAGGKSEIATIQAIGRGLRRTEDKDEIIVVDFFNPSSNYLISHFGLRIALYCRMGWM